MNLAEFENALKTDDIKRTEFVAELADTIQDAGLLPSENALTIQADEDGNLSSFTFAPNTGNAATQLAMSNKAIKILKKYGVTDFSDKLEGFNPDIDPFSWNVVYKDGGWVINGQQVGGLDTHHG